MEETTIHEFDKNLICEYFLQFERQGPGSTESTLKALDFINNLPDDCSIADLGCGTGSQTMVLAHHTKGTITALDMFPDFIKAVNNNAAELGLQNRVKGVAGSMENLPFQKNEFDLIWSEGAVAQIGFEKGLTYWRDFLKKDGFVAVTYESWFTGERPAEIETWWLDAVPEMNTIGHNVSIMQKAGYVPAAVFTLPEKDWTNNYFVPQKAKQEAFLEKYSGNKTVEEFIGFMKREAELYEKYRRYYGYVFYIGKKIE